MRNLSVDALAKLQELGTEPQIIVGVQWVAGGQEFLYGDKAIPGVEGRIMSISNFSTQTDVDSNSTVSSISIVLQDSDGALKNFFENYDIHKRVVNVYQYFTGLALSDKFAILPTGQITSPIVWDESARTLSFSIDSKIEEVEAGFSTESATLNQYGKNEEKNWPLCFGDVLYVPCTQVNENPTGRLKTAFSLVDPVLLRKRQILQYRQEVYVKTMAYWGIYFGQVDGIAASAVEVLTEYIEAIGQQDQINRNIQSAFRQLDKTDEALKKANNAADIKLLQTTRRSLLANIKRLTQQQAEIVKLKDSVSEAIQNIEYELGIKNDVLDKIQQLINSIFENNKRLLEVNDSIAQQQNTVRDHVFVEDGRKFPQNEEIDILINNVKFRGIFVEDRFNFTQQGLPKFTDVELDVTKTADTFTIKNEAILLENMYCFILDTDDKVHIIRVVKQDGVTCTFELQEFREEELKPSDIPAYDTEEVKFKRWQITGYSETLLTEVDADPIDDTERQNIIKLETLDAQEKSIAVPYFTTPDEAVKYVVLGTNIKKILEVSDVILQGWVDALPLNESTNLSENQFFADFGADVMLAVDDKLVYVANILPSEVVGVYAYRTIGLDRILDNVPSNIYTIDEAKDLGDLTITTITLDQNLSKYRDQNWDDDIYVSLKSSVGPNTVDIIIWLLETYTTFTYDATTFNAVRTKLENYPMHFAIFERKNIIEFIKEIAKQARCAVWQKNNVYYIRYLSEEPSTVDTITDDDVIAESLKLELTSTDDIATKLIGTWRPNYLPDSEQQITLRHNINKYGTIEEEMNFYAYTNRDLVEKSLTFWLIRKCNSWVRLTFQTPLTKLNLEAFDAVFIEFDCLSVPSAACIIESSDYSSDENTITFQVWTPIRVGT